MDICFMMSLDGSELWNVMAAEGKYHRCQNTNAKLKYCKQFAFKAGFCSNVLIVKVNALSAFQIQYSGLLPGLSTTHASLNIVQVSYVWGPSACPWSSQSQCGSSFCGIVIVIIAATSCCEAFILAYLEGIPSPNKDKTQNWMFLDFLLLGNAAQLDVEFADCYPVYVGAVSWAVFAKPLFSY